VYINDLDCGRASIDKMKLGDRFFVIGLFLLILLQSIAMQLGKYTWGEQQTGEED